MKRGPIRLWFCFAVAMIAAAVADPSVEALSNAGTFGRGVFTDHSNLDVLPAIAVGAVCVAAYFALRVRRELVRASGEAVRDGVAALLPTTFAGQLGVLAAMETIEQLVVYGHPLGGTIWLGGPVLFSLLAHALACVLVAFALSALLQSGARSAVRTIRLIRALLERALHGPAPLRVRARETPRLLRLSPTCNACALRAPPVAIV